MGLFNFPEVLGRSFRFTAASVHSFCFHLNIEFNIQRCFSGTPRPGLQILCLQISDPQVAFCNSSASSNLGQTRSLILSGQFLCHVGPFCVETFYPMCQMHIVFLAGTSQARTSSYLGQNSYLVRNKYMHTFAE